MPGHGAPCPNLAVTTEDEAEEGQCRLGGDNRERGKGQGWGGGEGSEGCLESDFQLPWLSVTVPHGVHTAALI